MRGVYLVASELSHLGFVASPTSRSAIGADILVTDRECKKTYSVQVKTNATTFSFWLLNRDAKKLKSPTYIYVFVNLKDKKGVAEYFVVPSNIVAKKTAVIKRRKNTFYSFSYQDAKRYENMWSVFTAREGKK